MKLVQGAAAAVGALLVAGAVPGVASAGTAPGSGYDRLGVVVSRQQGAAGGSAVLSVSADGSVVTPLVTDPGPVALVDAGLDPDGAAMYYRDPSLALHRITLGGAVTTPGFAASGPFTFSPDGRSVVETEAGADGVLDETWVVRVSDGVGVLSARDLVSAEMMPDGRTLIGTVVPGSYLGTLPSSVQLHQVLVDAATGTFRAATDLPTLPSFSPDGRFAAFIEPGFPDSLVIDEVASNGSALGAELSRTALPDVAPNHFSGVEWAPDGSAVRTQLSSGAWSTAFAVDGSGQLGASAQDPSLYPSFDWTASSPLAWVLPAAMLTGVDPVTWTGSPLTAGVDRTDVPAGSTTSCSVDGGPFVACGPSWSVGTLALGSHRLVLRTTSAASTTALRTLDTVVADRLTCSSGSYDDVDANACTPAPAGYYVAHAGDLAPTACDPGTYASSTASSACSPAPPGSYASVSGLAAATPCPAGTFADGSGNVYCTASPAGTYIPSAGSTSADEMPCAPGSFAGATFSGNAACTPAPAGMYVATAGASSASICDPGTYSATPGSTSCTLASPGYAVPGAAASAESPCAPGGFADQPAQTACTLSTPGHYVASSAATAQTACAPGSYQPASGAASCLAAPAGRYVPTSTATTATPCPVGRFSARTGATACTPAPVGHFVPTTGARAALPCAIGRVALATGRSSCGVAPSAYLVRSFHASRRGTTLTVSWAAPLAHGLLRYQVRVDGKVLTTTTKRAVTLRVTNKRHHVEVIAWFAVGSGLVGGYA